MAKPRRRSRENVSLFPFLSVLACVIGSLTLVIAATAIGQIATDAIDLEQYEHLERRISEGRREIAELTALLAEVESLDANVTSESEARAGLEAEREQVAAAAERSADLRRSLATAESQVRDLERDLDPVEQALDARRREIAAKKRDSANAPILIQPSGSGFDVDAHFVECTREGLVLYEGRDRQPTRVAGHRIGTSADYHRFLRFARLRARGTIVFLVRPGGVPTYDRAAEYARRQNARFGKIPLPGLGALDFSAMGAS